MKLKKNSLLVYISVFSVAFLTVTYLLAFLVILFSPKQDITNLQVTYVSHQATDNGGDTVNDSERPTEPTEGNNTPSGNDRENYTYDFIADLSEYEKYMDPDGDEYLTLINADNRLDADYIPDDLIPVINTRNDRADREMREYAAKALEALFIEAEANGMLYVNEASGQVLSVMSAYRSYNEQNYLHEQKKAEYASYGDKAGEMAAQVVQYPGASEHQSGLCCDMHNIPSADVSFKSQDAAVWLAENCYKFGFILRYPEDKTEITGVSFEPWHFRYVGRYHASKMNELDMCLEEYCEYLGK